MSFVLHCTPEMEQHSHVYEAAMGETIDSIHVHTIPAHGRTIHCVWVPHHNEHRPLCTPNHVPALTNPHPFFEPLLPYTRPHTHTCTPSAHRSPPYRCLVQRILMRPMRWQYGESLQPMRAQKRYHIARSGSPIHPIINLSRLAERRGRSLSLSIEYDIRIGGG